MLGLGAEKLRPFPADAWGVDVDALRNRLAEDLALIEGGSDLRGRIAAHPPRIRLIV